MTLRTTDHQAARAFYVAALGDALPLLDIVPLHEQALARGARPHWLGFIEVADVDTTAATFTARGAQPLAPKWVNPDGLEAAVMRDPGGAIVALARQQPSDVTPRNPYAAVWCVLNTTDLERSKASYGDLFGWDFRDAEGLDALGTLAGSPTAAELTPFAAAPNTSPVGALSAITRPGVHPHWLFFFGVPSMAASVAAVQAAGGTIIGTFEGPAGEHLAVCEDPQGAAFGLYARS